MLKRIFISVPCLKQHIQDLFLKITIKLGFKFLDAGYGTVNTTAAVAKKVGDSSLVMRCDPDKSRTEIAQKKSFI